MLILVNHLKICPCKKEDCKRFGKCEECIDYHKMHKKYAPYCMRKRKADNDK